MQSWICPRQFEPRQVLQALVLVFYFRLSFFVICAPYCSCIWWICPMDSFRTKIKQGRCEIIRTKSGHLHLDPDWRLLTTQNVWTKDIYTSGTSVCVPVCYLLLRSDGKRSFSISSCATPAGTSRRGSLYYIYILPCCIVSNTYEQVGIPTYKLSYCNIACCWMNKWQ